MVLGPGYWVLGQITYDRTTALPYDHITL